MARSWGDGSPTQPLHHIAFDMYEDLAKTLQCTSYRKLPVISVSPEGGGNGVLRASQNPSLSELIPSWYPVVGYNPWVMVMIQLKLHPKVN